MTAIEFYELGLKMANCDLRGSSIVGERTFKCFFGTIPENCERIWGLLAGFHHPKSKPKHILWTLLHVKQYNNDLMNKGLTGADPKTFRKWVEFYLKLIQDEIHLFDWDSRKNNAQEGSNCFVSLDGTDCPIERIFGCDRELWSHKFRGPGLRYEVGLGVSSGQIVWIGGGFPCGPWPDLNIARHELINYLDEGERIIADLGYRDDLYFVTPASHPQHSQHLGLISKRHETINARLKTFKVLSSKYRHSHESHYSCFHLVATIVQLNLIYEPLWHIDF